MGYIAIIVGLVAVLALVKISVDLDKFAKIVLTKVTVSLSEQDRALLTNFRRRKPSVKKEQV